MKIVKKLCFLIVIVAIIGAGGYAYTKYKTPNEVEYETVKVQKGNLTRTVEATGKVQSNYELKLRFEMSGTIAEVNAIENSKVKKDDVLATLNLKELDAAYSYADANLKQQLAGSTNEELNSYKSAMDTAKANWDKAKADTNSNIATAEAAVSTAKNNLKLAEGGLQSTIVTSEYQDAVAVLQTTVKVLSDAMSEADNILGIDSISSNDTFEDYLSIKDINRLSVANNYYSTVRKSNNDAIVLILPLTTVSLKEDIDKALNQTEIALSNANQLLYYVNDVLDATFPMGSLTQTTINSLKSGVSADRGLVTTQYTSIISQKQDIVDAKNSYQTYKITYDKTVKDLTIAKMQQIATLNSYEAVYNQAVANYKNKLNPPRAVDVATYKASLQQAAVNRDKAILKAPIDGIITKIYKKIGEFIASTETMFELVNNNYEIEVDIPETDISKVANGNAVIFTFDSFGDRAQFRGKIDNIDPKSTEIQDVVYYKVKINLYDSVFEEKSLADYKNSIKPGMTVNVEIDTTHNGQFNNVLYLPLRAILTQKDGTRFVRVLEGGKPVEKTVILGERADDGNVIIKTGLKENTEIVLRVKDKKEQSTN